MLFGKIKKQFPYIRQNEPLKNHCSFRVGGLADLFCELNNIEELPPLIIFAEENSIPYKIMGRGTNILFTDKGFRGLIVKNITNQGVINDNKIIVDSGMIFAQIIVLSAKKGLAGLEPFYGLPGTIGGAVYGNAGIPGAEIGQFVKNLMLFNVRDGVREIAGSKIDFRYRWSSLQKTDDIILRITLELKALHANPPARQNKQPKGYSAGSFFKNPSPDKPAGYLIDQAGLKGFKIGDAQINSQHANFFINLGHATASDIFELMKLAQKKVYEKFKIQLDPEVKIIGDL